MSLWRVINIVLPYATHILTRLFVCARSHVCLLASVVCFGCNARPTSHSPASLQLPSCHASLFTDTPLFVSPLPALSIIHFFIVSHAHKQTRVHTDAVNCIIVKTGLTKWEAKREGNRATGYVRRGVGRINLSAKT